MQETKTRAPAEESPTPRPSWVRVVALLAAVALLGGALFATWQAVGADEDNPSDNGGGGTEPDFSLTDEQAIARFEELDRLRVDAYKAADVRMVSDFAGPGTFRDQIVEELRKLKRDDVTATLDLQTESLEVVSNTSDHIRLQQQVVTNIRFFDSSGQEVTKQGRPERWTINWGLQNVDSRWLISSSKITDTEAVK
jgi:hypothetical protein